MVYSLRVIASALSWRPPTRHLRCSGRQTGPDSLCVAPVAVGAAGTPAGARGGREAREAADREAAGREAAWETAGREEAGRGAWEASWRGRNRHLAASCVFKECARVVCPRRDHPLRLPEGPDNGPYSGRTLIRRTDSYGPGSVTRIIPVYVIRILVRITDEPSSVIRNIIGHPRTSSSRDLSVERGGGKRGTALRARAVATPRKGTVAARRAAHEGVGRGE